MSTTMGTGGARRGASRSAALVAACRMLEHEQPVDQRLFDDPFARLVVDDRAIAAARNDPPLQNVIRLRTRYIDDAIGHFAADQAGSETQVLLLGAGLDARAYRLPIAATFFEVDFPATLDLKAELLANEVSLASRTAVPVDLAAEEILEPLIAAGFSTLAPTIVIWEGVSMYLDQDTAEGVIAQLSRALSTGSQVIADYAEMSWFKGSDFESATTSISRNLSQGGEPLKSGLRDTHATFINFGFDILDDVPTEDLRPRYRLEPLPRHYPTRMITAQRTSRAAAISQT